MLVVGDSLQRQLHARLVHMFRGSSHPVDYRIAGLARYSLCRAGDAFRLDSGCVFLFFFFLSVSAARVCLLYGVGRAAQLEGVAELAHDRFGLPASGAESLGFREYRLWAAVSNSRHRWYVTCTGLERSSQNAVTLGACSPAQYVHSQCLHDCLAGHVSATCEARRPRQLLACTPDSRRNGRPHSND